MPPSLKHILLATPRPTYSTPPTAMADPVPLSQHPSDIEALKFLDLAEQARKEGKHSEAHAFTLQALATKNPQVASMMVDELAQKAAKAATKFGSKQARPNSYSPGSNAPYYKEEFALDLKPAIDAIIAQNQPMLWRYAKMPRLSKQTIKAKILQALAYLAEHMDTPEGTYSRFREFSQIRTNTIGVELVPIDPTIDESSSMAANFEPVGVKENRKKWREELDEFMENGEVGQMFKNRECLLTDEEVVMVVDMINEQNARLKQLVMDAKPGIDPAIIGVTYMAKVTNTSIVIVKRNPFELVELSI